MMDKPIAQMDELELRALERETASDMQKFKDAMSSYATAVRLRQRVIAQLRDRFGFDCRSGRKVRGGDLFGKSGTLSRGR